MNTKTTLGLILGLAMPLAFESHGREDNGANGAKEAAVATEAAEGVNSKEMETLKKRYKWKKGEDLPTAYTLDELTKVMDDCADNTLELEDYDWQARKVVMALMTVGDKPFAKELDGRAVTVQKEVILMLKPLWEKYGLKYPEVQELAEALKKSE